MKIKAKLIFFGLILVLTGCREKSPKNHESELPCADSTIDYPTYSTDSICAELLKDTLNQTNPESKQWIICYADSIRAYGNRKETFFPYRNFDRVIIFRMPGHEQHSVSLPMDTFFLNTCQTEDILEIINNPLYFTFAECGTPIFDYQFQFLNHHEIIEVLFLDLDCNFFMTDSKVKDMNWQRMKYGAIVNREKIQRIKNILIETNAIFKSDEE